MFCCTSWEKKTSCLHVFQHRPTSKRTWLPWNIDNISSIFIYTAIIGLRNMYLNVTYYWHLDFTKWIQKVLLPYPLLLVGWSLTNTSTSDAWGLILSCDQSKSRSEKTSSPRQRYPSKNEDTFLHCYILLSSSLTFFVASTCILAVLASLATNATCSTGLNSAGIAWR